MGLKKLFKGKEDIISLESVRGVLSGLGVDLAELDLPNLEFTSSDVHSLQRYEAYFLNFGVNIIPSEYGRNPEIRVRGIYESFPRCTHKVDGVWAPGTASQTKVDYTKKLVSQETAEVS
jgi:hypothetical protein